MGGWGGYRARQPAHPGVPAPAGGQVTPNSPVLQHDRSLHVLRSRLGWYSVRGVLLRHSHSHTPDRPLRRRPQRCREKMEQLQQHVAAVERMNASMRSELERADREKTALARQVAEYAAAEAGRALREEDLQARVRALELQAHPEQGGGGPAGSSDSKCVGCCKFGAGMHASLRLQDGPSL